MLVRTIYEISVLVLLSVMFYRAGCTVKDFSLVFLMAVFVLSVMCGNKNEGSYLTRLLSRIRIPGEYTYAIYCNHWLVNYFVRDYFPGRPFYPMLCIYLVLVILLSIITTKLIKLLKRQYESKFWMKGKV